MQSIEISTIAHATDDLDKVQSALRFLLPDSLKERDIFTRRYMQGHYRNPIVTFDAKLTKSTDAEQFARHMISRLSRSERLLIQRDLELHSDDEGHLYIRLDKQQAFRGIVELGEEDPIRVKIKFTRFSGETRDVMKKFLESE